MDVLSLIAAERALFHLSKAYSFLPYEDAVIIDNLKQKYKNIIDSHNNNNLTVINPTKTELGSVQSSLKKIVIGFFAEKPKTKEFNYSERYNNCRCCENLVFCKECEIEAEEAERHYKKNEQIEKPYYDLCEKLKDACDKTKLSEAVVSAKILLIRRYPQSNLLSKGVSTFNRELMRETNECVKKMMLEEFMQQNKEFNLLTTKNK